MCISGARRIGYMYVEITKIREKYKVMGGTEKVEAIRRSGKT